MNRPRCLHVLVVDDTPDAERLAEAFVRANWRVSMSSAAIAAIDVARYETLDSAVVALWLSEDRGDIVFYRLVSLQPGLRDKVVLLTLRDADAEIASVAGCSWIQKPVDAQAVVDTVSRLIKR